jgi:protein ImuB
MWLYCHFPQLQLDNLLISQPEFAKQAVALYRVKNGQSLIEQTNLVAQEAGVSRGISSVMAIALYEALLLKEYEAEKEEMLLSAVADHLYQWAAKLILDPPQGIYLELKSIEKLYGGLSNTVRTLNLAVQQLGFQCQRAVAKNTLAARVLAQANTPLVINKAQAERQLKDLSIKNSGLPNKTIRNCLSVGIFSIGDLLTIPASDIGRQFGKETLVYVQALRDDLNIQRANHFYEPSEYFFQQIDLVSEVSNWQGLRFPMKRLLNDLESFLYQRQKAVQHITFQLFQRDNHCTELSVSTATASWRAQSFWSLLQLKMERSPLAAPVLELSLKASEFSQLSAKSQHFFHEAQDTQSLFPLIGKLQVKLGERAVYTPAISDDPRPGFNECRQPPCRSQAPSITPIKRPLWLQREPQPVNLNEWRLQEGPERKHCGWWDSQPIQRDYWLAMDTQHRKGWLFYESGHWYLQGWFS